MNKIFQGDSLDVLKTLEDCSVDTCITSPPYFGLRDYGMERQIGLEETPEAFVESLVEVFREVRRVLKDDGTLWLNLGDSYATNGPSGFQGKNGERKNRGFTAENLPAKKVSGLKPKDLIGIPWRVAFALQADRWYLRQDIIWAKPNPMPESVTDRCTKAHEYIFLLSKSPKYYFDNEAIKEQAVWDVDGEGTIKRKERAREDSKSWPTERKNGIRITYPNGKHKDGQQSPKVINGMRNKRSVWTVTTKPYKDAHFATFPADLIEPCVIAGAPKGGVVLDPFFGSGTTGAVALRHGRKYIGIELNPAYIVLAEARLSGVTPAIL